MSEIDRVEEQAGLSEFKRRRVVALVLLLTLTLVGGVAARITSEAEIVPPAHVQSTDPDGSVRVSARLDRTRVLQGGDGLVRLELSIVGAPERSALAPTRMPTDLVVVLDRSGSMQGAPIADAIASVRRLIDTLGRDDRFALITYASGATTVIPLSPARPSARDAWADMLSRIEVGGGTNMSIGIDAAAEQLTTARRPGRVSRVVLVSDGHANQGDHSRERLLSRAARAVSGEYAISTVGVGENFDESLMAALADAGTGNFYFVERGDALGDIFAGEFASARSQLASALEVEIEAGDGVQVVSAAGYPLDRRGEHVAFRPGSLFAGQERRIWLTFRVPTAPSDSRTDGSGLAAVTLHYMREGERRTLRLESIPEVAVVAEETEFLAAFDGDAWASSVAEEELGELKQTVSAALRSNDPERALARMQAFRTKQGELNEHVKSPAVASILSGVAVMEQEVVRAAKAKDESQRNRLSKKYSAEGYDGRRQGAKYLGK